ncbi:CAP domain-containing protein [Aureimonas altamirensis]|uniref:CAP domain-containing protein n=1 Tax=Aureimonas altamirensis TaxID=370622 RepID=UPI0006920E29|nr:CAP domain-containing protein [Aureimonas altamirensis]
MKETDLSAFGGMSRRAFVLAGCAALLAGCAGPMAGGSNTVALPIADGAALASVNRFRAANGLPPLSIDGRLMQAARIQAEAMAASDTLSHTAGGRLPGRVSVAGYEWSTTAENIGRGYADYEAAMRGWIGSPGHRRNLLNPNIVHIGFAGARRADGGRNYWAQVFAAPRPEAAAGGVAFRGQVLSTGGVLRFP